MAQKRMFNKSITNSSMFLMMPPTSRLLYYDLGMNADDDGFCEHFAIMKMTDATPDDLRILQVRGLVKVFDEKVLIILDWKENNYIQKDRYTPSKYLKIYEEEIKKLSEIKGLDTKCIQAVYKMDTQYRLDKIRLDKNRIEEDGSPSASLPPSLKGKKKELTDIQKFVEFYKEEFAKINDTPPIVNYGKVGKLLKRYFKELGTERLKKLLIVYLATDDPFYEKAGYSLDLFLSASTLHSLQVNN